MRKVSTYLLIIGVCIIITKVIKGTTPNKTEDYSIDIHDNGTHTAKLKDLHTGEIYIVQFDSLEETIVNLNR